MKHESEKELRQWKLKLKEMPDIRVEKVKKLKRKIKAGKYNIESREIVKKIAGEK